MTELKHASVYKSELKCVPVIANALILASIIRRGYIFVLLLLLLVKQRNCGFSASLTSSEQITNGSSTSAMPAIHPFAD